MTTRSPEGPDAIVGPVAAELDTLLADVAALRDELRSLPGLMADWEAGEPAAEQTLVVAALPGPTAVAECWNLLAEQDACFVLPDAAALAELEPREATLGIRAIVGETDAAAHAALLAESARLGVRLRTLADPPSWYAVHGDRCGYPMEWDLERPAGMLVLHDAVAAGGFRLMFEELWRRATPPDTSRPAWEPVLRELELGRTESQIARRLHLSERTVRRRIREAATALGASNRFTLGLAWAESGGGAS